MLNVKINDNFIEEHFLLSTIDPDVEDTFRFDRRKVLTPYSNKYDGKPYKKKLLDEDIYNYLCNRYNDSKSIQETLYRIHNKIDIRPVCVICGKEVEFCGLCGGFKDACSKECHNKHRSQWCTIHEKHYHCPEITGISQLNDEFILKFFFKGRTPKETGSLMNSYVMVEFNEKASKFNLYNKHIYKYLKTRYDDCDYPPEVLYRIKNNINSTPTCRFCGDKLPFIGLAFGYRTTCCKDICIKAYLDDIKDTTARRKYKELEDRRNMTSGLELNDDVILNIFGMKYGDFIGQNKLLLSYHNYEVSIKPKHVIYKDVYEYLKNRFDDSQSIRESLHRISFKEYTRPVCKNCGKPVEFVGKPSVQWRTCCSYKCSIDYLFTQDQIFDKGVYSSKAELKYKKCIKEIGYKVKSQYKHEKYPYHCDFYLPELDLYIEYNGYVSHGLHPFRGTQEDIDYINNHGCKDKLLNVFAKSDIKKRKTAKENNLNYLELWPKDSGVERMKYILDGLIRMRGKSNEEIRKIIQEISLYETIYDDNIYLG